MFHSWQKFVDWLIYQAFGLDSASKIGSALNFFIFDTGKIFVLLILIVFFITLIRSFFPPEKTRRILAGKRGNRMLAYVLGAMLGIVTPFCSCSAVPLFIGFVEAGIPLGATFSFLVAAPMVNEVALGLLFGLFGFRVALIYVLSGEIIAIVSGLIIGRMKLEREVEGFVYEMKVGDAPEVKQPPLKERLRDSWIFTRELLRKIWPFVIGGIAIGGLMHGWVPAGALARYAGRGNPFAVLVAVIVGIPLYATRPG